MLFPANSRYLDIETTKLVLPDGTEISYLRRRFLPPPERFALLQQYQVTQGDRLDNIAARYLGDPEQFWRICDANGAMRPDDSDRGGGPDGCASRCRMAFPEAQVV